MKLAQLTPAHVRQAVAIYVDHAWPEGVVGAPQAKLEELGSRSTLREMRGVFVETSSEGGADGERGCRRFALRLGNRRYPWMKFVIQEYLVAGEFFFSVDTHDDLRVDPDSPDYLPWCDLQRFNRDLKREIEADWAETDLPTHGDLRALCEGIARVGEVGGAASSPLSEGLRGKRLLVVDDDEDVAFGAAAVLTARGYQVETAFDGRQVLDRMALDPLPDLVVLDFAMPEFDGEEVMRRLRADPRTENVPLLLATASDIDLSTIQRASGLLRKPYPRSVLYGMIDRLLNDVPTGGPDPG
ncbi:Response regulator PleD [Planctomycetes bacterium Poly30]|uniref:Response regulator PleD n=1 Tax=Saltatorellus ferox TaxID=2528018 RepID=A0A518ESK6_9BACT|nr:Response regulator PleD [Planctomycetes bacterium Poly30]